MWKFPESQQGDSGIRPMLKLGVAALTCLIFVSATTAISRFGGNLGQEKKETFPQQVLIIRHAEKPSADMASSHLSQQGTKRAEQLFNLFDKSKKRPNPFPTPDFIFAARDSKNSTRPSETVTPLAKKLNLKIDGRFGNEDGADLAKLIFGDQKYAGKVVLLCWRHGSISQLAKHMKAANAPESWKDEVFDRVWQITYENGKAIFKDRPQSLMDGDSSK
ncbi:hypothetical protein KIH39_25685 [Telmatocola sphagniphila]|uniref:Histidine phosphatase family protein n=1 Tax=Telmatocola sphagniphila TaxID=1123043 RepID=A0A8E6B5A5_9BACT|nr:hypothetical protein [Telmatocola sphagniphila]QVL32187.1 hypothetical protein KIH39_25685 [Telmatocola sphagniphila]